MERNTHPRTQPLGEKENIGTGGDKREKHSSENTAPGREGEHRNKGRQWSETLNKSVKCFYIARTWGVDVETKKGQGSQSRSDLWDIF